MYELKDCKVHKIHALSLGNRICLFKRNDAIVQPVVEDRVDDDRILVEAGAEMVLAPCAPSEFEKMKHELTHITSQPWCRSCVKGNAHTHTQSEPHKRRHIHSC